MKKADALVPSLSALAATRLHGCGQPDHPAADRHKGLLPDVSRTVVDLAVGVKVQVYGNIICFVSAIVPLTNDGPHADVMPTGEIQVRLLMEHFIP